MKTLLSFLLLLIGAATHAAAPEPEFNLTARGEIIVEKDGSVRSYALDEGLSPQVSDLVAKNVATWRFEPILVDAVPVVAKTRMALAILARPHADGGYVLRLEGAWFGDLTPRVARIPPKYPRSAIEAGFEARVTLVLKLDAAGNVVDAHPYQTSLSKTDTGARERRWRSVFEQASVQAAKRWKYEPSEIIDGEAVGGTAMIGIDYQLTSRGPGSAAANRQWRAYLPGPITPAPWVDASSLAAVDTDALEDGRSAAVNSRFRLVSDVLGKAL